MLSPSEGGGGGGATPGICGAFDLCCLPHPREFDQVPRLGAFALFAWTNGTKSHRPMCAGHLEIE